MKKILSWSTVTILIFSCQKPVNEKSSIKELPPDEICASQQVLDNEIVKDPTRIAFLQDLEEKTKVYSGRESSLRGPGKLYLPVVIHIVLTDPSIVTDAMIQSQLAVWNADFNKANTELSDPSVYLAGYSLNNVANCQIEFYVTNVVRVVTTIQEFPITNVMKSSATGGSDPIDPATKFNVWVCNTPGGNSWGQFPGGNLLTDGIVVDYYFFGSQFALYKGRVGTHEVGHWLNLRHIWGDRDCGDDLVKDTPPHTTSNRGCPAPGLKSTCKNRPLMMWMNYMDYSYGQCTYMFSAGQKQRMDAAIDNARRGWFKTSMVYLDYFALE